MFGSAPKPPPGAPAVVPVAASLPEIAVQNSLALGVLTPLLRGENKLSILDLGAARAGNIEFFGNYLCKLYIADLYDSLLSAESFTLDNPGSPPPNRFAELLEYPDDTRFDIILGWDLFNYFSREQLQQLAQQLGRFCKPGSLLFSIISGAERVPEHPRSLIFIDEASLGAVELAATRANSRHKETNVVRLLPGFRAHKTFLLRNGVQECLFSYA